jgi:hypothetical protein
MDVKNIWTDEDFEKMKWHDNYIHSISFPGADCKMSFDIDYIFEWELNEEQNLYKFWISPCVIIFSSVLNLKIAIDFNNSVGLDISEIKRLNPRLSPNGKMTIWDYIVDTDKGTITFESTGYIQKVRKQPILSSRQLLPREEL